jgi:hypothetical protein
MVILTLTYSSEVCTLTTKQINRIEFAETRFVRSALGFKRLEKNIKELGRN